ncbi:hypothetical protein LPJ61_001041 [Coemansia biformis]|uniref:Protein YOP1 n=1 Tax=Coemansia biformis TaxID=1286918 RepID=A0A9W8CYI0_9FUNG|nr:hypothetical protein LPJ61_001041 [Coemansia biformis]
MLTEGITQPMTSLAPSTTAYDDTGGNMADAAAAFLAATERLPRERYPMTRSLSTALGRLSGALKQRLPPHLHPLVVRFRALCVRQTLLVEKRVHMNPAFRLLLGTRIIPPGLAFAVAAASTVYVVRHLYLHALDLLTNLVGVAYPAYQSIMCIEYGELPPEHVHSAECSTAGGQPLDRALGLAAPNLDKKQWLMYWSIFGLLTTADHWAGPILRMFPVYRLAKIAVLVWAQHRRYNGAAWLYDTFVRPLLPPPASLAPGLPPAPGHGPLHTSSRDGRPAAGPASTPASASRAPAVSFQSLEMPSVWESTAAGPKLPAVADSGTSTAPAMAAAGSASM